jgi:pimeloyl-ACP methyl ester carboxylesterase
MASGRVEANGIEIAYETFGDPSGEPMLLVMGLGTQMLAWPEPMCRDLAAQGFHVVRFDNRDSGLSTHLDGLPAPDPLAVLTRRRPPAYRLDDMAADAIGLIEALNLGRVHLVGASMGGFLSQIVVLRRPDLLATLTLMMTSTGALRVGRPSRAVVSAILRRRPAADRESGIAASMAMLRLIGSPGRHEDDELLRELAERSYDRGYDPAGQRRQLGAVLAQTDRTDLLASVAVPTLVMHGLSDPLVAPSGGLALARAIPGARFVGFQGMGHDLPSHLWTDYVAAITQVARLSSARRSQAADDSVSRALTPPTARGTNSSPIPGMARKPSAPA